MKIESQISFLHKKISFDEVMNDLGFHKYQIYLLLVLSPIAIADGTEALVLSLLIPIFQNEWNATEFQLSMLGTLIFFGYLIGAVIAGPIADKYGRKKPLIISTLIWTVFAVLSALAMNIYEFMIYRFVFGVIVGFIWPVGFSLLTEYCPLDKRGKYLNIFQIFYPVGETLAVLLGLLTLNNLKSGNWRILLGFSAVPAVVSFVVCCFYVDESARFELQTGKYESCFQIINKIAKINKNQTEYLTEAKKNGLIEWSEDFITFSPELKPKNTRTLSIITNFFLNSYNKISELFKNDFCKTTLIIWFSWFANNFVYFGVSFATPLTLVNMSSENDVTSTSDEDFLILIYSNLGEAFSCVVCALLVDLKWLGRKYSLVLSSFLSGFFSFFLFLNFPPSFAFWVTSLKFMSGLVMCVNYLYTSEIHPTKIRATGVGMASSVCRTAPMIVPWVTIYLTYIHVFLPYLIFGIVGGMAGVFAYFIKHETYGKELDYLIIK